MWKYVSPILQTGMLSPTQGRHLPEFRQLEEYEPTSAQLQKRLCFSTTICYLFIASKEEDKMRIATSSFCCDY